MALEEMDCATVSMSPSLKGSAVTFHSSAPYPGPILEFSCCPLPSLYCALWLLNAGLTSSRERHV